MKTLVLASTSPYRKELLTRLGLPFESASPDVDESRVNNETPAQLVERLAELKAQAVVSTHPDALIIGSDQVAVLDFGLLITNGPPGRVQADPRVIDAYLGESDESQ